MWDTSSNKKIVILVQYLHYTFVWILSDRPLKRGRVHDTSINYSWLLLILVSMHLLSIDVDDDDYEEEEGDDLIHVQILK